MITRKYLKATLNHMTGERGNKERERQGEKLGLTLEGF